MTQLNLGKIRMRFVGDYDAAAVYVPTDIIRDPSDGSLYVPKVAAVTAGTALTNTAFYAPLLLTAGLSKTGHQHVKANITDFNDADYAAASHTHAIAAVNGLQNALDGKSATGHQHEIADVNGLQDALDNASGTAHSHTIADVTGLQGALDAAAPLADPALTGTPTAPTAAPGTNTTQIATTAFVDATMNAVLDGAPAALDTLAELAAAIADDEDFAATITAQLGLKANSADLGTAAGQDISYFATAAQGAQAAAAMPKTGGVFSGTVTFSGSAHFNYITNIDSVTLKEVKETLKVLSGTTQIMNTDDGTIYTLTTSGNTTLIRSAIIKSGFTLVITMGGNHLVYWPSDFDWGDAGPPTLPASGGIICITGFSDGSKIFVTEAWRKAP